MDSHHNRYLLMRHGHSQANAADLIISHPASGREAYGLSDTGEAQLATLLEDWRWPTPTRIHHSDFLRTTQTAARIAAAFGLPLHAEPGLRERHFGALEAGSAERYPEVWARDAADPGHRDFGVEPVTAVAARLLTVIDELEDQYRGETLLLVSHGDPLQILLTALEGRPLNRHRDRPALLPASITLLEPET
jgi:broad specificity phosphatase PhoE